MSTLSEDVVQVIINDPPSQFGKLKIIKNIVVLSAVLFIMFTAHESLLMLQSTINHENGLGIICVALGSGCFCISSLLLPKYVIKKLGCKITLVLSMFFYLPYIASNMYPHFSFMVPAAILVGFSASLLWSSQCQYLNEMAVMYATEELSSRVQKCKTEHKNSNLSIENVKNTGNTAIWHSDASSSKFITVSVESRGKTSMAPCNERRCEKQHEDSENNEKVYSAEEISFPRRSSDVFQKTERSSKYIQLITARIFGIYGMVYLSTHIWSNLGSFFILQKGALQSSTILNSSCVCGAQFCNERTDCFFQNFEGPSPESKTLLISLCTGLGFVSVVLLALLLDPLNDRKEKVKFSFGFLFATCRHLKKKNQVLLIPLSFYVGMMQGFYMGDFNVSFVGCALGTYHVSLVSVCYGAASATSSSLSGFVMKYVGRVTVVIFAALTNITSAVLLLVWKPNVENPSIFFIMAGLWGISVGILFSQLKAMYGFLFKNDEEVAFAAFHLWYSLGFCLSFAYSNHLCTFIKIYVLMFVLIVGTIGYLCVELFTKQKIKQINK